MKIDYGSILKGEYEDSIFYSTGILHWPVFNSPSAGILTSAKGFK